MLLFNLYLNTNILSDSDFDREGQKVPLGEARSNQTSGKTGFLSKLWGDTDTGWGEERHWLNMVKLMMAVWIVYFLASAVRVGDLLLTLQLFVWSDVITAPYKRESPLTSQEWHWLKGMICGGGSGLEWVRRLWNVLPHIRACTHACPQTDR